MESYLYLVYLDHLLASLDSGMEVLETYRSSASSLKSLLQGLPLSRPVSASRVVMTPLFDLSVHLLHVSTGAEGTHLKIGKGFA